MLVSAQFKHGLPIGQWKVLHNQFCHKTRVTVCIGKLNVKIYAGTFEECESMTNLILAALTEYKR